MSIIIDKIVFENYRQYGTGTLRFNSSGDGLLSVIVAKNGTGKTTLLNAITWCLYDKELHLADDKKALPLINSASAKQAVPGDIVPVTVAITIIDDNTIIEFNRTIDFKVSTDSAGKERVLAGHSRLTASLTPAGAFSNTIVKTGVDADIIVKQYFDEAIFKFYFFDGEKLRDFFTANQANSIQQSIFNISQVTLLDNACNRLHKMHNERIKKLEKDAPDIAVLNAEREKQEKRLNTAMETLSDSRELVTDLTHKREKLDEILRGYAPVKKLQKERQELEEKLNSIDMEEDAYRGKRVTFIRQYMVLLKLYPRIKQALTLIKKKEADGDLPPAIDKDQVRRLLEHLDEPCPLCNSPLNESCRLHLETLLQKISVSSNTSNYLKEIKGPLEAYIEQVYLFKEKLDELRQIEMDIAARKTAVVGRLQEITSALSNFENESDQINVAKIEEKRASIINQINAANQTIGAAKVTISTCKEHLSEIEADLTVALQKMSEHDDIRKQLTVIDKLHTNFKSIKISIMEEMKREIETTTWKFFDSMIWKRNTFGSIFISEEYDIAVYNKDHVEMTGSLSATEQMALAYAFTLAIHKASGKNCPLVIDSPLGRVSDENRENMARALLDVSRNKQIIMLFTPDEYSESVKQIYDGIAEVRILNLSDDENYIEGIEQ